MPVTVKVNGVANSLVHKGSNGTSIATIPDVCKTPSPGGPVPMPYPNISQSAMLSKGTTTVKADGMMIAVKGSEFSISNGDQAGTVGGVKSNVFMKESTWILYSFDVKMDGKNACRLTDKMFHNHENTVNLAGVMQQIAQVLGVPEEEARIICEAFCQAQKEHLDPNNSSVKGQGSATRRFGELVQQKLKNHKLEQSFFIPRNSKTVASLLDAQTFQQIGQRLAGANGFPAIAGLVSNAAQLFPAGASVPQWAAVKLSRVLNGMKGNSWIGGIGRPDLVVGGAGNMKAFDCKFTSFSGKTDELSKWQKRYYPQIDSDKKTRTIDEDSCKCPGGKKQGWRASPKK